MEGRIDICGELIIRRGTNENMQECPFKFNNGENINCSDDCALFGEPSEVDPQGKIQLQICQGRVLYFDELIDKRV